MVHGIGLVDLTLKVHYKPENDDMLKHFSMQGLIYAVPEASAIVCENGYLSSINNVYLFSNGEKKTFLGIDIEAVPMYNLKLGSGPGKPFHHKGIGNGYILSFGDTRVYFSGDTECVPEMKALKNITIAFVAMNPPRTMPPAEAAACVTAFQPKIVYPYHYRGQNTQEFADGLKSSPGVEVRLRKLEGEP